MAKGVYLGNWKDKVDMVGDFANVYLTGDEYRAKEAPYSNVAYWLEKKDKMKVALASEEYAVDVLLAWYEIDGYEGDAFVLFEKDGKLFEVNGGHCSCYGLEDQWKPEETTVEALQHRIKDGSLGRDSDWRGGKNKFAEELSKVLKRYIARKKKKDPSHG